MQTLKDILRTAMTVASTLLLVTASVWFGFEFGRQQTEDRGLMAEKRIPSIEDIQQLVGCEKIDGKLGPETMAKWNRAVCDQYYTQSIKQAEDRRPPRKNFPIENSPAGFSGEKPNGAGASQGYANDCGVFASLREAGR